MKPPQNPVIKSNFKFGARFECELKYAEIKPTKKQPRIFTENVASGNENFGSATETRKRQTLPSPPPIATKIIFSSIKHFR